ncbi:MAG: PDZ domain-containing protein [Thermoguttaceae bacterium]|nr:PDZ domain-containing protein [Thermoguttaceae bacterium]
MKKNLFAFAAACLIAAFGAASVQAQELDKNATPEEIAAFEAENFVDFDELNADGAAKAAQKLIAETEEGAEGSDAKCWFWGWRYYYYPSYYYYTWYCPCYYVPFRIVTYTVPTTVVTTPVVTAQTTTTTTTASTVAIAKSSGKTACGAVIDQSIPSNSPLAKMGLKVGDVVTHVDGVQVKSLVDLRRVKADSKLKFIPGDQISVSKKQINHVPNENAAKALENGVKSLTALNIGEKTIDENETVSLYEYYEALEKNKSAR